MQCPSQSVCAVISVIHAAVAAWQLTSASTWDALRFKVKILSSKTLTIIKIYFSSFFSGIFFLHHRTWFAHQLQKHRTAQVHYRKCKYEDHPAQDFPAAKVLCSFIFLMRLWWMLRMGQCKMCIKRWCISKDSQEIFKEFCCSRMLPWMQAQIQYISHIRDKSDAQRS